MSWRQTEPWIETLIQNYDNVERTVRVQADVLGVGAVADWLVSPHAALLFFSDGAVQVPGILTSNAWRRLQELEERESLITLTNNKVSLWRYTLMFQADAEERKCQFFLTVDEMTTVASGTVKRLVPSCTVLPSVKQKIVETWRSLKSSGLSQLTCTQSGLSLTELLIEWQDDRMSSLLQGIGRRLWLPPCEPCTSHEIPPPVLPHTSLGTRWDRDRVRYKEERPFTVHVSHLFIPLEEREQILAAPGGGGRQGSQSHVTVDMVSVRAVDKEAAVQVSHEETQNKVSPLGSGQQDQSSCLGPTNPWDVFAPVAVDESSLLITQDLTPDLTSTSTNAQVSTSHSEVTVGSADRERPPVPIQNVIGPSWAPPPALTPQQRSSLSLPPNQKPPPSNLAVAMTHAHSIGEEGPHGQLKSNIGKVGNRWKKVVPEEEEEEDDEAQVTHAGVPGFSPPSWLCSTGPEIQKTRVNNTAAVRQPSLLQTHPDGVPFDYTYQPTEQVTKALSIFSVPNDLVQWSVRYLVQRNRAEDMG